MKKSVSLSVIVLLFVSVFCSTVASAGQKYKDTIIFAQGADLTSLDPHIGKQLRAFDVTSNMFDTLVKYDENMEKIIPGLATSWERISDTEVRFFLRKDVKWHNGDPFTAADVKFSYERMLSMPIVVNNIAFLDSATVEDDYTVVLKTKYPYAPLLASLTNPPCAIVPKKVVEADSDGFALHPVGTGPYKFVEWKPDEYCKLEAFDGYYGEKAKTKNLIMKVVPESNQRSIMLETGEINVGYDIPPIDVKRIGENKNLKILQAVSNKTIFLNFNAQSKGPLGNKLVRQAIAHAIDRESIVIGVLNNFGAVANLPIPPGAWGYDPDYKGTTYDVEKAKELLKEAGYSKGFDCSLWVDDNQVSTEVATVIQNQLLDIGVNMQIEVMKQATKQSRLYKGQDFDMNMSFFNCNPGDGDYNLYSCFHPASKSNHCRFDNPACTELIEKSRAAYNGDGRKAIYRDIFDLLEEEMPALPLYYETISVGAGKNVQNLHLSKIGAHKYQGVCISE